MCYDCGQEIRNGKLVCVHCFDYEEGHSDATKEIVEKIRKWNNLIAEPFGHNEMTLAIERMAKEIEEPGSGVVPFTIIHVEDLTS